MGKKSWFMLKVLGVALVFSVVCFSILLAEKPVEKGTQTIVVPEQEESGRTLQRGRDAEVNNPVEADTRLMRDDGSPTIPTEPASPMSESQEIYIYVTLRQPECAGPPDSIGISDINCESGAEYVQIKANRNPIGSQWFNVYRDVKPMFWITSIGETNLLPNPGTSIFYNDYFADGLWVPFGSKGVCDCDVNYFYVMTSGDTLATGDTCESAYPSNVCGEFDFCLCEGTSNNVNFITYCLLRNDINAAGNTAQSLVETIGGATVIREWNGAGQTWTTLAEYLTFPFPRWENYGNVQLGYPYLINGSGLDPMWSMQIPGLVPPDPHFTLYRNEGTSSLNMVSLPFMEQQIADITTGAELGADIPGCTVIREWNCNDQSWTTVAEWLTFPFPRWENYGNVTAGYPYMIAMGEDAPATSIWPPAR